MTNWKVVMANRPQGIGGRPMPLHDAHSRKVAVCRTVILTAEKGVPFAQKDFLKLAEFEEIQSDKGVGDFIGGKGLDLDKERTDTDWLILPSAWNAARAWDWLREYPEDATTVAESFDVTTAQLEARIIAALEPQEPAVEDALPPAVEDALPPAVEDDDEEDMAYLRAALEEADAIN